MDFDKAVAELDALVQTLEREEDERALHLLQLMDAIHRPALEAIIAGRRDDPAAAAVLIMYGIGELDERGLVEEALEDVRPYINSHGGEVELIGIADGVVRLRMSGSCDGCAASTMTLKRGIETAIRERWPEVREVVAEEPEGSEAPPPASDLLQIENVKAKRPIFADAGEVASLAEAELRSIDIDGAAVLLAKHEGEIYAFRDGCPMDGRSLAGGRLADGVIVCPWHNCAYDTRSGRRADGEDGDGLPVIPVAIRDGCVQLAVNVG